MRNYKKIFAVIMIMVLAFAAVGCGGEKDEKNDIIGKWKLESLKIGGKEVTAEQMKNTPGFKDIEEIEFKEDNTVSIKGSSMKWEKKDDGYVLNEGVGGSKLEFKGDMVTITLAGMEMNYKR